MRKTAGIISILYLFFYFSVCPPLKADQAVEDQDKSKIKEFSDFLQEWNQVDQSKIEELFRGVSDRDPMETAKYVRHRVNEARQSQEKWLEEAMIFQGALKTQPDNQYLLYESAYFLALSESRDQAVQILLELKRKYPECPFDPYLNYSLGANYSRLDRPIESIAYYEKVIPVLENFDSSLIWNMYNDLGNNYQDIKEYEKSIEAFEQAIQIDPQQPFPYQNLGITYQELKEWDKAIEYGQKAVELESYPAAHLSLANAYFNHEEYEKAVEQNQLAISLLPGYKEAWLGLGNSYLSLENYTEAEKAYRKALEIDPQYVRAWAGLGWLENKLKNYETAVEYLTKALEFEPADSFAKAQLQIASAALANPQADP